MVTIVLPFSLAILFIAIVCIKFGPPCKSKVGDKPESQVSKEYSSYREFFKWLSKAITPLQLLRLDLSRALSKSLRISTKLLLLLLLLCWSIALFAPAVIGRSNYFGIFFTKLISKPLSVDWLWNSVVYKSAHRWLSWLSTGLSRGRS